MHNRLFIILALIFISLYPLHAQVDPSTYDSLVAEAEKHYAAEAYLQSARHYAAAFAYWGDKGYIPDRYQAARAFAMAQHPDSAFVQLFLIAEGGSYTDYEELTTDSDLKPLYAEPRWEELKELVRTEKEKKEANYDHDLIA